MGVIFCKLIEHMVIERDDKSTSNVMGGKSVAFKFLDQICDPILGLIYCFLISGRLGYLG